MRMLLIILSLSIMSCIEDNSTSKEKYTNQINEQKMLIVLSAPSVNNTYYTKAFNEIVNFHVRYAKAVMGNDNIVILVDESSMPFYEKFLPKDILLSADIFDIWMRDFTTVSPLNPIQFRYTEASMSKKESKDTQASLNTFAGKYKLSFRKTDYIIDGGNIVDNYKGKIITTTRFIEDNYLTKGSAKSELKRLLNAKEVAIIESDDDVLAHADGMVMWIEENSLLLNDYSSIDKSFRDVVYNELKAAFPSTKIIEVPFKEVNDAWKGFASATGINVNSTLSFNNIYVPVYGMEHEAIFFKLLKANTSKKIIKIKANGVSPMGGSVRCLTWQLTGNNAKRLIKAARE